MVGSAHVFDSPVAVLRGRASVLARVISLLVLAAMCAIVAPAQGAPAQPLQVDKVVATTAVSSTGTTVFASFSVKNRTGHRTMATPARLFLVGNKRIIGLGKARVPALVGGERTTVEVERLVPTNTPAGRYAVRGCLTKWQLGGCEKSERNVRIAPAKLVTNPVTVPFGATPLGKVAATQVVTVTNAGQASSGMLDTTVTGSPFTVAASTCSNSLAPGASCTVDLTFAPTSAGAAAGTLRVVGRRAATAAVALTGAGTETKTDSSAAALSIAPGILDFKDNRNGSTSAPVQLIVTNTGDQPSGVPAVTLAGAAPAEFALGATTCTTTLAPAATCTVAVTFGPIRTGVATATVDVAAQPGGTATVALTGTGTPIPAYLRITPGQVTFAGTIVDGTTASQTLTVKNTGQANSGTPTVALSGAQAGQFDITATTCATALPGGATCTIDVAFAPTTAGHKSATLTTTATPGGTATATLSGTGEMAPTLSISASTYDFGFSDQPQEKLFTITNTGNLAVFNTNASLAGDDAFATTTDTCPAVLLPGASCSIGVTYTGTGTAQQQAQLRVSGDNSGNVVTADLTGSPVGFTIAPMLHNFGSVPVGTSSDAVSFVLTNHTSTQQSIIAGRQSDPFAVEDSCLFAGPLPAKGTCVFKVRFTPTVAGTASGVVGFGSRSHYAETQLAGTGQAPATLSITPSPYDFGRSTAAKEKVFTITNTGDLATGGTPDVALTGDPAFAVTSETCDAPLTAGGTCTVSVTYTPSSATPQQAQLAVTAPGASGASAAMSGRANPLSTSPSTYDFGSVPVGSSSTATFVLRNDGPNSAQTTGEGYSDPAFRVGTSCFRATVAANGGMCTFTITFTPTSEGPASGYIIYFTSSEGSARVDLSGVGGAAAGLP